MVAAPTVGSAPPCRRPGAMSPPSTGRSLVLRASPGCNLTSSQATLRHRHLSPDKPSSYVPSPYPSEARVLSSIQTAQPEVSRAKTLPLQLPVDHYGQAQPDASRCASLQGNQSPLPLERLRSCNLPAPGASVEISPLRSRADIGHGGNYTLPAGAASAGGLSSVRVPLAMERLSSAGRGAGPAVGTRSPTFAHRGQRSFDGSPLLQPMNPSQSSYSGNAQSEDFDQSSQRVGDKTPTGALAVAGFMLREAPSPQRWIDSEPAGQRHRDDRPSPQIGLEPAHASGVGADSGDSLLHTLKDMGVNGFQRLTSNIASQENAYLRKNVEHLRGSKRQLEAQVTCLDDRIRCLDQQNQQYKALYEQSKVVSMSGDIGGMEISNLYEQLNAVQMLKDVLNTENMELQQRLQVSQLAAQAQKNETKHSACVICMDNLANVVCLPCKHLSLCSFCSANNRVASCPICRCEIDDQMQIFMP